MARGAYDTTIEEEIRRHGGNRNRRAGEGDASQEDRDAAVRRMNLRRGKRNNQGPSANSTAYTPEDAPRKAKSSGGGDRGDRGKNKPSKSTKDTRNIPIPADKPDRDPNYVDEKFIGFPWAPAYRMPGDNPNVPMDPNGGGGGGGGPLPVPPMAPPPLDQQGMPPVEAPVSPNMLPPELIPLLAAAGVTSAVGRSQMKAYPSMSDVDNAIRVQPHIGGVPAPYDYVDAEVMPENRQIASPRQRMAPDPLTIEHMPAVPMDIPVGDKPRQRVPAGSRKAKPRYRVKAKTKMRL